MLRFSEDALLALTPNDDTMMAMAKAVADGLETEGVEQMWAKLNQKNAEGCRGKELDRTLLYVDPEGFLKKTKSKWTRKTPLHESKQLLLFGDL